MTIYKAKMGGWVEVKTRTFFGGTFVLFIEIASRNNLFQVKKKDDEEYPKIFSGTLVINFDQLLAQRQEKPIQVFP